MPAVWAQLSRHGNSSRRRSHRNFFLASNILLRINYFSSPIQIGGAVRIERRLLSTESTRTPMLLSGLAFSWVFLLCWSHHLRLIIVSRAQWRIPENSRRASSALQNSRHVSCGNVEITHLSYSPLTARAGPTSKVICANINNPLDFVLIKEEGFRLTSMKW